MMDILDECYESAKSVVLQCSTSNGLFASAGKEGYDAIWARDSMITLIGASLVNDNRFKECFKKSLITLGDNQSRNGQIPNCVDKWSNRKPHVDFQTIDSTLWYLIGHHIYRKRYKDNSLFIRYKKSIERAFNWLSCQDSGENTLLTQQPTSDWQDAFPHKYGNTINTDALYYKVLNLYGKKTDSEKLNFMVNKNEDTKLWNGNFYVPYRWKNHNKYKEIGDWFDSLGNSLAIVFGLSSKKNSIKILKYIDKMKINRPYPMKTIYPAIEPGSKNWHDYFYDCDSGIPYHYSNGGIWTFNGNFYILALIKMNMFEKAKRELKLVAKRNLEGNFPEWTDPITLEHHGMLQAWEAGTFILAYESLKNKKILI